MEALIIACMFLGMIMRYRYLQLEIMGLVGYFTALAELPGVFYSHFNRALSRYLPSADAPDRVCLFSISLSVQVGVVCLFLIALLAGETLFPSLAFWDGKGEPGLAASGLLPFFALFHSLGSMVNRFSSAFLGGIGKLFQAQRIESLGSVAQVASVAAVATFVPDRNAGVIWMLGLQLGIQAVTGGLQFALALIWGGIRPKPVLRCVSDWKDGAGPAFRKYYSRYTLPLQASAIFAYVKENLAILILGQANQMDSAGLYQLANKVFYVPRKFIPGLMDKIMPKLVEVAHRSKEEFHFRYGSFCWAQFWSYAAAGTALLAACPFLGLLFSVEDPLMNSLFFLFSINLLLTAMAQMNINIIFLGNSTLNFMWTSLARSIVVVIATFYFIQEYRVLGAGIGLVISSLVVAILLALETRGSDLFDWDLNWKQGALGALIGLIWLAGERLFGGVLAWG